MRFSNERIKSLDFAGFPVKQVSSTQKTILDGKLVSPSRDSLQRRYCAKLSGNGVGTWDERGLGSNQEGDELITSVPNDGLALLRRHTIN